MNETTNYIESYFSNALSGEERKQFEQQIVNDATFAGEVAFYLNTRQAIRQQLLQEKQQNWAGTPTQSAPVVSMPKPAPMRRRMAAAAVAVMLLGLAVVFFISNQNSAQRLAKDYIESPEVYSNTMDASQDSLQQGIAALKTDSLDKAASILSAYYTAHPEISDALKFNGIALLRQKKYDAAIESFNRLSALPHYDNMGPFYRAVALLLRNNTGDTEQAHELLNQVLTNPTAGNKNKAREILQKL